MPKETGPKPNVVLITIDTTRADRMGFLGSNRGLTPNLDTVAKQATAFSRAFSQVPITTPSHASILSGTYPQFHHVNDFGVKLPAEVPYLPDLLHQNGYQTAAFVASFVLDPRSVALGFDRGFDTYDAGFRLLKPGGNRYGTTERRAEDVVAHALAWFDQRSKSSPFFMWVHLYDPHDPYDPPEPYKSKFSDPYDGEIAYADAMLGKLFAALRTAGVYDGTLIAVMADHGEAFGEHGEFTHGIFLYDETLHVPLLIKMPASSATRTAPKVDTRVSLVDVVPTILQSAGLTVPDAVQGASLLPLIRPVAGAPPAADRPAYAENDYPHHSFAWSSLRSWRTGKYLYIEVPKRELYDQNADPASNRNLAEANPAVADTLNSQLETFRAKTVSNLSAGPSQLNPQQVANLNSLGYVASNPDAVLNGMIGGIDPKDRIEIGNSFHYGLLDLEEGRVKEGIARLEQVVQSEHNSVVAYERLAGALVGQKDYQRALPVLRRAVELRPDSGILQYRLGLVLSETGNVQDSVAHFELAVKTTPGWPDAMFALATIYLRTGREAEARAETDKTLEAAPAYYKANLLRGWFLMNEKPSEALENLQKAAEEQPDAPEPHQYMAEAYQQLGDAAKAAKERGIAERLHPQ